MASFLSALHAKVLQSGDRDSNASFGCAIAFTESNFFIIDTDLIQGYGTPQISFFNWCPGFASAYK